MKEGGEHSCTDAWKKQGRNENERTGITVVPASHKRLVLSTCGERICTLKQHGSPLRNVADLEKKVVLTENFKNMCAL